MSHTHPADEAAIRQQAYFLWEKDGRPHGRDNEYWMRAVVALSESPPERAFPSAPPPKAKLKSSASPRLSAAASKSKAAPAKSAKASEKKPKKK
jgi:hypothetical protein